jgi:hypothetical protein
MRFSAGVLATVLVVGCAVDDDGVDEANGEFRDSYESAAAEFPGDRGDFPFGPCDIFGDVLEFGDSALRAGYFGGVVGQGVLGPAFGMAGMDVVFDLYHRQLLVSNYTGVGATLTPKVGGQVEVYGGVAFGFQQGVADWYGYFVSASAGIGGQIPFFSASLNGQVFVSGVDTNGNGVVDGLLSPPEGVYGFAVGVEVGMAVSANPFPVDVPLSLSEGYWQADKARIRGFYERFQDDGIDVYMRDADTGERCPEDWPAVDTQRNCVIQFGQEHDGVMSSARDMVSGMCDLALGCTLPMSWAMASHALATAAIVRSGLDLNSFCGE